MPADRTRLSAAQDRIVYVAGVAHERWLNVVDAALGRLVVRVRVTGEDGSTTYVRVDELGA